MDISTLVVAALIGLIPAAVAQSKGRSFGPWWLYGFLLFIVALPHSLMLGGAKCPQCAEFIKREAKVCRFCRYPVERDEARQRSSPLALVILILMVIVGGLALVTGLGTTTDRIFENVDASLREAGQ